MVMNLERFGVDGHGVGYDETEVYRAAKFDKPAVKIIPQVTHDTGHAQPDPCGVTVHLIGTRGSQNVTVRPQKGSACATLIHSLLSTSRCGRGPFLNV